MDTKFYLVSIAALVIITGFTSNAQITLNESDMPMAGNTYYSVYDTTPVVTPGGAGTGQTWDLSAIHDQYIDTIFCLVAASTPYAAIYPGSDLVLNIHEPSAVLNEYYNLSSASMATPGGVTIAGATTEIFTDSPLMTSITFPATYLSDWGGKYRLIYKYAAAGVGFDSLKIISWITYTDTVDAWGTVTTPAGSYNSLRVKQITTDGQDSIYEYSTTSDTWVFLTIGTVGGVQTGNYTWYANSKGIAVAGLVEDTLGHNVTYASYLQAPTTGIENISLDNEVKIYPNPGNGEITINLGGSGYNDVKFYDMLGRQVYTQSVNAGQSDLVLKINESKLPGGVYLLQIENKAGNINKRVVIEQ